MEAMVVKGGETTGGWKKRVVACLLNGLQASNPSPKSILARPKALQDVSCRNTELPVEG